MVRVTCHLFRGDLWADNKGFFGGVQLLFKLFLVLMRLQVTSRQTEEGLGEPPSRKGVSLKGFQAIRNQIGLHCICF